MDTDLDLEQIRADTAGIGGKAHLLASGSSLMPRPVVDAIVSHTLLEAELGGYEAHAARSDALDGVYASVAKHINAQPQEIALMENATVAWCHAFYALPLAPGMRILTCETEYAANYVALLQRAKRDKLTIEVVPSDDSGALDLAALEAMLDEDVGLIAITWVPTNGGLVNPAKAVGALARKFNVPYLLDACQAAGQMRIDVADIGCDFLSATGRKFLRGPRGTGFLYVRDAWIEQLEPVMIDHFAAPWVARDRYALRADARRFETWENAYALRAGLGAAFDYVDKIGIDAIETRVRGLADLCRAELGQLGQVQLRDLGQRPCGIVSFTLQGADPRAVVADLSAAGYVIGMSPAASTRLDSERRNMPDVLRIAPHYYNSEQEVLGCVNALKDLF
ncbi:MAG: aminotransferase class V-fold PLP-dependent enzyme [Thalassovita sp.]